MNKPFLESIIFHLVVAILLVVSTWSFFSRKDPIINEIPIVVTMAPMGEKTNVKPAPKQETKPPTPKKAEPKKPEPKKVEPKKPEPKKPEPKKPEPKKPEPKVDPKKAADKKPEKKPEKKEKVDELDALLKNLDDKPPAAEKSSDAKETKEDSKSDQPFDPNSPETLSAVDYIGKMIKDQVQKCWVPPAGGRGANKFVILVNVDIAPDGTMKFVGFEGNTFANDPVGQAAADAAKRAVLDPECNPLRELPPADKYSLWKEVRITFDPKDLAN